MKQQTQTAAAESGMTAKKTQHQKIVAMVQIALFMITDRKSVV